MPAAAATDSFGPAPDGSAIALVQIGRGALSARLMSWGASLCDLRIEGHDHSLVLGSSDLKAYLGPLRYYGAIVGRVANRIAGGSVEIDGEVYALDRNENNRTTLHGGTTGSAARNWALIEATASACRFGLRLPHRADGFPGTLDITATYCVTGDEALRLEIEAVTDAPTLCNFAHHAYWTLDGAPDLSGHTLCVHTDRYLPVDAHRIPCGGPEPVGSTRFDLRAPRPLLAPGQEPLDHNFCLSDAPTDLREVARLEAGNLSLGVLTTAPGLQVYDGAMEAVTPFGAHAGVALEPQHWPDAPHHTDFPSITLRPGETYRQVSEFQFGARRAIH
ncbi:aldose epimerase family protein [Cucumibacter marinus]|uniref:aldose epimerase family protein n=1 Tax=Cucumibacter marinus TaxID=1121252 RepID=UPI0004232576|nr:aldose epimerase family protein [Cucumibacter marinus]